MVKEKPLIARAAIRLLPRHDIGARRVVRRIDPLSLRCGGRDHVLTVHDGWGYDLRLDSSEASSAELADCVLRALGD